MVHIQKKPHYKQLKPIRKMSIISLLISFSFAFIATVWAVYLRTFVPSDSMVGFISAGFMLISLISYILFVPFMEKHKKKNVFIFSLVGYIIIYVLFAITRSLTMFLIIGLAMTLIDVLRKDSYGVLVRNLSRKKKLAINMGWLFTLFNLGWLLGPIIAGFISNRLGIPFVFILAAFFFWMAFMSFIMIHLKTKEYKPKKIDKNIPLILKDFFRHPGLFRAYMIRVGITFWWAILFIYAPLFIIGSGLETKWVGIFLGMTTIPLILFEYLFGKIASKHGYRKLFIIGFSIIALSSLLIFLIKDIYWMMGLIIFASFGLAMVEPTSESHFFNLIKRRESDKYYGPYNTALDVGQGLGRLLGALVLVIASTYSVFLLTAVVMGTIAILTIKVKI